MMPNMSSLVCQVLWRKALPPEKVQPLTHEASFGDADIFFAFLRKKNFPSAKKEQRPLVPSRHTGFTHLQEMCQHHVHIHVLLLSPTSHEAQVLSTGNGARLQRLLLRLQERLNRKGKFGGVLEHLRRRKRYLSRHLRATDSVGFQVCITTWLIGHGSSFCTDRIRICRLTRSESKWKAVDRCPELYCSAGRQSTTKNRTPSYKWDHSFKWNGVIHAAKLSRMSVWWLMTCWLAWRISGTDTGRHRAWLRSVSSSFRATKLLPKRFWFI